MRPLGMANEVPGLAMNSFARSSKRSRVPRLHCNDIPWYSVMFDARSRVAFRSRCTFASVPMRWWFWPCSTGAEIQPSGGVGYNYAIDSDTSRARFRALTRARHCGSLARRQKQWYARHRE